jgi:hypothetical protein
MLKKNLSLNPFWEALFTLFFGLVAIVIASIAISLINGKIPFITNNDQTKLDQIVENTSEIKKQLTPYEYKDGLNKTVVIKDFENSTKNQKYTNMFEKRLYVEGNYKQAYLYVRASADSKSLEGYGDVYTKLKAFENGIYREYGGHLLKSKSLETGTSEEWTEYLFDLTDVKYKEDFDDDEIEVTSADWLRLLNGGDNQAVIGFTSTSRIGKIHEMSIYYKCSIEKECSLKIGD